MIDSGIDSGVAHGAELLRFAAAVLGDNVSELDRARHALADATDADTAVSASIIAAGFSLVDRAANGIGINVEPMVLKPSEDFRAELGINNFPSAANTFA